MDLTILWLIFLSYDHETVFGRNGIVSFFGNLLKEMVFGLSNSDLPFQQFSCDESAHHAAKNLNPVRGLLQVSH